MGTQLPTPKGAEPPIFDPYLLRPDGCRDQDVSWYGGRTQPRRLCVRRRPRFPLSKRGGAHKFSADVYCGQTAEWIKIIAGMEVGLSPGDFMLDGDPAPPQKGSGATSPIFGPFLLWPNGWMHQDATWYRGRPQPRGLCVRWGPRPPPEFSAHVYYSYCDFVRHSRYWFVQLQVQVLVLYFRKSLIVLSLLQFLRWHAVLTCF